MRRAVFLCLCGLLTPYSPEFGGDSGDKTNLQRETGQKVPGYKTGTKWGT